MAWFSEDDNSLDKYRDVVVFPWRENTLAPNPRDSVQRQQDSHNWMAELGGFFHNNGGAQIHVPPLNLAGIQGDIVIMGHGNYGDRIGKDVGYAHSARTLAKLLADGGLPQDYDGKVILWTCFAGISMARSLKMKLAGRGYITLTVWGCRYATANIAWKTFYHDPGSYQSVNEDGVLQTHSTNGAVKTRLPDMVIF